MGDDSQPEASNSRRHLRRRVERALVDGKRGPKVIDGLESLTRSAPEGNADALFAHRQLAELQLERSPWRAALHLRRLLQADAADDGVHALMGLCQALLGNFGAAVAAYDRATRRSPRNPWYHHNLGHLLDVGVSESARAERHLRIAHELQPDEDEITASLAHCLGRLGRLSEAAGFARAALAAAPHSDEHRTLLAWIEEGAPARPHRRADRLRGPRTRRLAGGPSESGPSEGELRAIEAGNSTRDGGHEVAHLLADRMPEVGFSVAHVQRALLLWTDFCAERSVRAIKPEVYAAAIEYAIARLDSVRGLTQASLAERYGVAPGSISNRYGEIRAALELIPGDPRYCGGSRVR